MGLSNLFRRWRALTHKKELDTQLDEELQFHLERDVEQNIKSGMTPADARNEALKAFGGVDRSKEECRDARGVNLIENTLRDITYSVRVLLKSYAFTFVVVLTLALGIGANTAIFSFANGILLRPLPYPQSDRLAVIDETARRGEEFSPVSYPNFLDWREQNTVFDDVAVHFGTSRFALSGMGEPVEIRGHVSHTVYSTSCVSHLNSAARSLSRKIVPNRMQSSSSVTNCGRRISVAIPTFSVNKSFSAIGRELSSA